MNWIPVAFNTSEIVIGQIEFLIKQKKKGRANTEHSSRPPQTKQDAHPGDRQAEEACPSKVCPGGFAWVTPMQAVSSTP